MDIKFSAPLSFQWDAGNRDKNFRSHGVTDKECEEAFFDESKRIYRDAVHSENEDRYVLIGRTMGEKILFIAFTVRGDHIRVISARNLNKKERKLYGEEKT